MTVEQSPLDRFSNQKPQQSPPILNVEKDVALSPTAGVIDLTNDGTDKEDDIKKAIALSLKEHEKTLGGQVSLEDQDISRVLEASLAESKAVGTKRKRGEVWQDPLNPHDRKRSGDWPVGLKNVGNTCWFSAVIQSLFHLPVFRTLVLEYTPTDLEAVGSDSKDRRNLVFMQELRKLFALLLCSKRKYVDPSHALEEFKEAFPDSSGTDSQQDVSEFTHKLLDWLEDAFKINSSNHTLKENGKNMLDNNDQNPMLNLFYGHYLSEGQNEGRVFCNRETFGQYPLQVNGFSNIHESLEAAMSQEIESHDVMTKSGQESWFTKLPPVLLFELSRFQFNQQLGRPEKIHNRLEFPEVMYMDRYMEQNKTTTRCIRQKVHELKEKRDKLQNKLEKYLNYGSGPKKVPLCDVLQYSLEFAESRKCPDETISEDVEMASPSSISSAGDSSSDFPNKTTAMEVTFGAQTEGATVWVNSNEVSPERVNHVGEETAPSPQHVSELELKVLQSCLKRWHKEVEGNVKNLQENINNIDNTIKDIYNDPSLKKKPYKLHAVLVHEGQAASGHYWAYVYCPKRGHWLKFNDVAVSEATWSELQKDSMGGQHYASAYCLLYVDELRPELFNETTIEDKPIWKAESKTESESCPDFLFTLPRDLRHFVEGDNEAFLLEQDNWDYEQTSKKDSSTMTMQTDGECTIICERRLVPYDNSKFDCAPHSSRFENSSSQEADAEQMDSSISGQAENRLFISDLSREHATMLHKQTLARMECFKMVPGQTVNDAFNQLVRQETTHLRRLGRMPLNDDPRLQHIGVYIVMNSQAADIYLNVSVLEQFLISELDDTQNGHLIKETAVEKLEVFKRSLKENNIAAYKKWHEEYHLFRQLVGYFILGIENYHSTREYHIALGVFSHCYKINSTLCQLPGARRGFEIKILAHYRRSSFMKLNDLIASKFEECETKEALEALSAGYEYILPSVYVLLASGHDHDKMAVEDVRNRWCSMLGIAMVGAKQERLQDFLNKLLDSVNNIPKHHTVPPVQIRIPNLEEKYRTALNIVMKSGEYEIAMASK